MIQTQNMNSLHKDYFLRCLTMLIDSLQDLRRSVEDSVDFDLGDIDVSLRMTEIKVRTLRQAMKA